MSEAQQYAFTLTGTTPLILHRDNLVFSEKCNAWTKDPANKGISTPGDDRTPAWRWIGCLYVDDVNKCIGMDSDNLMTCIREGAKKVPDPMGKKSATMTKNSQAGLVVDSITTPLLVNGEMIPIGDIEKLIGNNEFAEHVDLVESLGFELFVKRARIGMSKHVRVRPMFRNWSVQGTLTSLNPEFFHFTDSTLKTVLDYAGQMAGLGDWRPSSKTPGQYGKFTVELKRI